MRRLCCLLSIPRLRVLCQPHQLLHGGLQRLPHTQIPLLIPHIQPTTAAALVPTHRLAPAAPGAAAPCRGPLLVGIGGACGFLVIIVVVREQRVEDGIVGGVGLAGAGTLAAIGGGGCGLFCLFCGGAGGFFGGLFLLLGLGGGVEDGDVWG